MLNLHMGVIEQAQLYQSLSLIRYLFIVLSLVLTHFTGGGGGALPPE